MASGSVSSKDKNNQITILLIENDLASAVLTREALREAGLHEGVTSVRDGDEALEYLRDESHLNPPELPALIFLDLHLPRKSGLEVLIEIKSNPNWALIPVVVVSGSADPATIREAYELHASCFIRKPADLDEFLRFIRVCYEFWGSIVTLPAHL